jgi:hypothetical protein
MSYFKIPATSIIGQKVPSLLKGSPKRALKIRGQIYRDGHEIMVADFASALRGNLEIIHEINKGDMFANMPLQDNEMKLTDLFCDISDGTILFHVYLTYISDFEIKRDLQSHYLMVLSEAMKSTIPHKYPFRDIDRVKEMTVSLINKNIVIKDI